MMNTLLRELFSILAKQTRLNPLPFNEGCTESQVKQTEQLLNLTLPMDYRAFLQSHNGQSDSYTLTFPPDQLVFLPIKEVVNLWKEINQYSDEHFFDQLEADGKIRSVVHHPRRVPIAYNEAGGAYLFLDFIPGPNGKAGQLIFNINEVDNVVIADSLSHLVQEYVQLLKIGKIVVKKQPPEYGQGYWFVSSHDEYLNWNVYQKLRGE
jgi:cell wall assembly regulator SMI1